MKRFLAMSAMALSLALPACMTDSAINQPPGHYEHTTASTDSEGTTRERSKETDVWYDAEGNKHAVTKKTTSTDPKGLFNKKTTTQSESEIEPAAQ